MYLYLKHCLKPKKKQIMQLSYMVMPKTTIMPSTQNQLIYL